MSLIYGVEFNNQTRALSFSDRAGNNIYSCTIPASHPLTFVSTEDGSTIWLFGNTVATVASIAQYEVDTGNGWTSYSISDKPHLTLNRGESCRWRCSNRRGVQTKSANANFGMTGSFEAYGNIHSMLVPNFENITSLADYPYAFCNLFKNCTSLKKAPLLPATTLSKGCYQSLFEGAGVVHPPELPSTVTGIDQSFQSMFSSCAELTRTPVMPEGTYLKASCAYMFRSCSSLTKVFIPASGDFSTNEAFFAWLYNASASGDFYANPNAKFPHGSAGIPKDWERWIYGATDTGATATMYHNGIAESVRVGTSSYGTCYALQGWAGFKTLAEMHALGYTFGAQTSLTIYHWENPVSAYSCAANAKDSFTESMYDANNGLGFITISQQNRIGYYLTATTPTPQPLTLTAIEDKSSVKLAKTGILSNTFQIDTGSGWQSYTFGDVINLNRGDSIKWRCSSHPDTQSRSNYVGFNMTGLIKASGNCNSMLDGTNFDSMTSLVGYDYALYQLFVSESALTQAPELPAITLANWCYGSMFQTCRLLTEVRIAATTTAANALDHWLRNVAATGTVYADPSFTDLPTDSENGVPSGWTRAPLSDYPTT